MSMTSIPLRDLFIAFTSSKPTHYKAISGLVFTSSMNVTTISKLTLNDFLNSCNDYFNETEDKNLKNLLKKDPMSIIPSWNIKYKKQLTFNTPETSFFIFSYLKEKRMDDLDDLNQPLFKTNTNKFLKPSKISAYISEFNDILNIHHEQYEDVFKSKNLLYTFRQVCKKNINLDNVSKDLIISLFTGKNKHALEFYEYNQLNLNNLKKIYEHLIPFLTAKNYDSYTQKVYFFNNEEPESYNFIVNYYERQLKSQMKLDYKKEVLLCNFAYALSKDNLFKNTDSYLDILFKKSQVKLIIDENKKFGINKKYLDYRTTNEKLAEHLKNDIFKMKLNRLVKINEEEFYKYLIQNIFKNDYYNKNITNLEAKQIIEESLFEIIDDDVK